MGACGANHNKCNCQGGVILEVGEGDSYGVGCRSGMYRMRRTGGERQRTGAVCRRVFVLYGVLVSMGVKRHGMGECSECGFACAILRTSWTFFSGGGYYWMVLLESFGAHDGGVGGSG